MHFYNSRTGSEGLLLIVSKVNKSLQRCRKERWSAKQVLDQS